MDHLYHEIDKRSRSDIAVDGLLPMSYGQSFVGEMGEMLSPDDFDESELDRIPPADKVVRTYVMISEPSQFKYGDMLLRFPASLGGKLKKDVDYYISNVIPAEYIEVKIGNDWHDIRDL